MFLEIIYTILIIVILSFLTVYGNNIMEEYMYLRHSLQDGISQLSKLNEKLDSLKRVASIFPNYMSDNDDDNKEQADIKLSSEHNIENNEIIDSKDDHKENLDTFKKNNNEEDQEDELHFEKLA